MYYFIDVLYKKSIITIININHGNLKMKPINKYLIKAAYDWISDSNLTPYAIIDASSDKLNIPREHVKDGMIVLNVSMQSTSGLIINDDGISFSARFGNKLTEIYAPLSSVLSLYAKENGAAIPFPEMVEVKKEEALEKEKEDKRSKFKIVK
jgi:stringent starvation protein B